MLRIPWFLVLMLLVPQTSSALQLHWKTGADDLTFTTAMRCTLVVQADPDGGVLPPQELMSRAG